MRKKMDCRLYDYCFIFILLGSSYWLQHHVYFNWDASWHVEVARRIIAGSASYSKNMFDDNLPMVYWYFVPAVLLNHLTGIWVVSLSIVTVILTVFVSVILSEIFLKEIMNGWRVQSPCFSTGSSEPLKNSHFLYRQKSPAFMPEIFKNDLSWMKRVVSYALLILLLFSSTKEFAQRDMIVTVLIFPYILLMAARMMPLADLGSNKKIAILMVGVFALLGVAMNPFYGLLILALEAQYYFTQKKINMHRPELIILFLGFSAYLMFIVQHYPNYFTEIVPSYVALSSSMNASLHVLLIQSTSLLTYYATIIFILLRINKIHHPLFSTFYISMLSCFFVFLLNGKLFSGHIVFLSVCLNLFFIVALFEFARQKRGKISKVAFSFFILILLAYSVIGVFFSYVDCYKYYKNKKNSFSQLISFFSDQESHGTFLSLAPQEMPTLPVVLYVSLHNQTPWADCWPIMTIVKNKVEHDHFSIWKQQKIDNMYNLLPHMIGQILQNDKPEFILVNTKKYQHYLDNRVFNLIDFYSQDPFFKKNWQRYHLIKKINQYAIYARSNGKAMTS